MTSATKFIAGHSDVTAGLLSVRGQALADRVYFTQNAEGTALGPFDCWLCLRGLKTMGLRMERQQANAGALAAFLEEHPLVGRRPGLPPGGRAVNYPGLPGVHPAVVASVPSFFLSPLGSLALVFSPAASHPSWGETRRSAFPPVSTYSFIFTLFAAAPVGPQAIREQRCMPGRHPGRAPSCPSPRDRSLSPAPSRKRRGCSRSPCPLAPCRASFRCPAS